jgi:hypothetical protein
VNTRALLSLAALAICVALCACGPKPADQQPSPSATPAPLALSAANSSSPAEIPLDLSGVKDQKAREWLSSLQEKLNRLLALKAQYEAGDQAALGEWQTESYQVMAYLAQQSEVEKGLSAEDKTAFEAQNDKLNTAFASSLGLELPAESGN